MPFLAQSADIPNIPIAAPPIMSTQPAMRGSHFISDPKFLDAMKKDQANKQLMNDLNGIGKDMMALTSEAQGKKPDKARVQSIEARMETFVNQYPGSINAIAMADRIIALASFYGGMTGDKSMDAKQVWAAKRGLKLVEQWENANGSTEAVDAFRVDFIVPLINLQQEISRAQWDKAEVHLKRSFNDDTLSTDTRCLDGHRLALFQMAKGDFAGMKATCDQGQKLSPSARNSAAMSVGFLVLEARMLAAQGIPKKQNSAYAKAAKLIPPAQLDQAIKMPSKAKITAK